MSHTSTRGLVIADLTDHWSPKVVARLNDYEIKALKVQGEFLWHTHDDTDDLFLVIDGQLTIPTA